MVPTGGRHRRQRVGVDGWAGSREREHRGRECADAAAQPGWQQPFQFGQGTDGTVLDSGHRPARCGPQPDRHCDRLVIVEKQRRQRGPRPEPVAAAGTGSGVHRIAEAAQPLDVVANGAGGDAESFGQRPFRIEVPQADLEDLRSRLAGTRWPARPRVDDWSRGVPVGYLKDLVEYWATGFDWRAQEAALNKIPQFTTEIDGQTIHFLHKRSPEPDALPLILTHGWPSSPVEFTELIGPLTDPRAHGADPADAFHVVVPSLPGYGFSNPMGAAGFNLFGVTQSWAKLMSRLGYERYAAQGTDVGSGVAGMLPMVDPQHVVGVHLSGTGASTPFGPALELDGLSVADRARAEKFNKSCKEGLGYLTLQETRPQTLAYSLNDSPVGQLAWIVEKFYEWTDPAAKLPEEAVDRDHMLTNISIFWFTGSGASAAHAVYEGMRAWRAIAAQQESGEAQQGQSEPARGEQASPPTGVAVFAADTTIRSLMDPLGKIEHWSEYDRGGHFAAMEVPDLLTDDIRTFCRPLR
jgi:pimeloyl-ACP methyl ester carboxylesterase